MPKKELRRYSIKQNYHLAIKYKEKKCKVGFYFQKEIGRSYRGKYCSIKCYILARWASSGKCKTCGNESITRFCSNQCRNNYWNKNYYHLRKKLRMRERKNNLIKELGGKCTTCGNPDIRVLEIHHKDKSKKKRPKKLHYTMNNRLSEWYRDKSNLELLCANCHRIHTWEQMGYVKI